MSALPPAATSLERIVDTLNQRFEIDAQGRIVRARDEGVMPRFVLGRSFEGCVWRFAADLDRSTVVQVAKLAGREPGFPIGQREVHSPPERWVVIERILQASIDAGLQQTGVPLQTTCEAIKDQGVVLGEIWTLSA